MKTPDVEVMFSKDDAYVGEYNYRITVVPLITSAGSALVGHGPSAYWFLQDRHSANVWYDELAYQSIMYCKYPCRLWLESCNNPGTPLREDVVGK